MIDIRISPCEVVDAKKAIREMVQDHNRYNRFNQIELRCPYTGQFESLYNQITLQQCEEGLDEDDWTCWLCVEFEGAHIIASQIESYFGERNVAMLCC